MSRRTDIELGRFAVRANAAASLASAVPVALVVAGVVLWWRPAPWIELVAVVAICVAGGILERQINRALFTNSRTVAESLEH